MKSITKSYLTIAALALFTTNPAFASKQIEQGCGISTRCSLSTNYMEKVKELFDHGSLPTDLVPGIYAGRCYNSIPDAETNSKTPSAAALVIQDLSVANNEGPLFPSIEKQFGFTVDVPSDENVQPDYFDNGNNLTSSQGDVKLACEQDNALVAANAAYADQEAFALRKNGDYFVTKAIVTVDEPSANLKAGDAYGYCYFFKKVK